MAQRTMLLKVMLVLALLSVALSRAPAVLASLATPAPGATGYDVSYPQCGTTLPADGAFGVVGVTNGLPFSANPCLAEEYGSFSARGVADLYINAANPAPHSTHYWPASNSSDPALCVDATSTTDPGCAYDYGWHAALNALSTAQQAIGARASNGRWWLDVESDNSWNGDPYSNAADIQGMADALRSHGVPAIGVFSTSEQWQAITGGLAASAAASYAAHWKASFTAQFPVSDWLNWVPGAATLADAMLSCRSSFTGTAVQMAQYTAGALDGDVWCPNLSVRARAAALGCDSCQPGAAITDQRG